MNVVDASGVVLEHGFENDHVFFYMDKAMDMSCLEFTRKCGTRVFIHYVVKSKRDIHIKAVNNTAVDMCVLYDADIALLTSRNVMELTPDRIEAIEVSGMQNTLGQVLDAMLVHVETHSKC